MNKIAITGVSGFLGRNLAAGLSAKGYEVVGCDRQTNPGDRRWTQVDITDREALLKWLEREKPAVVFHLAARTDLLGRTIDDYAANTRGVTHMLAAGASVGSVKRVIFASSRMVCRIDHVPTAYDQYSPPNAYGLSKVEGEKLVRQAAVPFEWVIVRPTSIWGPGFGIPYRNFFDQVRKRRYFHPGPCRPHKSFGYIGNTVFQLEQLMLAGGPAVDRRTFYLGDYQPLDIRVWADHIHREFGYAGSIPEVPLPLLRAVAKAGDLLNFVTGRDEAPLTTFRLNNLITEMVYPQLAELREVTGDLPVSWQEGTRQSVAWLRSTG